MRVEIGRKENRSLVGGGDGKENVRTNYVSSNSNISSLGLF